MLSLIWLFGGFLYFTNNFFPTLSYVILWVFEILPPEAFHIVSTVKHQGNEEITFIPSFLRDFSSVMVMMMLLMMTVTLSLLYEIPPFMYKSVF